MQNDYIDFKFGDHWASEFNLLAVSSSDRYTPPVYGSVNPNIATIMGKKGVYKWKTQVNEKIFNINIAFDSVTIAQLNQIKQWLQPNKIQKLIFSEEPYKYYWAALNAEIDFSHLPFVEGEKQVGERTIIEGVYKGEMVISFVCIDNDGYSTEGTFEGLETENPSNIIKGNDFILTDADNDYIEDLKIEGKSEQETKYNNTLSDTDFADVNSRSVEKAWKTNNLAQIQAENGEVTISAPYQYSGIAQEQREALIDHKYFASAEINTDSLDTALEIAGKNITNSIEGKDINITDGLVGPVDDLVVSGDASQDKLYNNEINSSFLEDLDNWEEINEADLGRKKQTAIIESDKKYGAATQKTEESNIGDKYYLSAKIKADSVNTVLEVETEKGAAEGSNIIINDASDNKMRDFKLYGNSTQEVIEEVLPTIVEGEFVTAQDITLPKGRIGVYGNSKQETSTQGKNYFTGNKIASGTAVGVTYSFDNSIFKMNGTTTRSGNIILDAPTTVKLPAGTYTWTIKVSSGNYQRPAAGTDFAFYLRSENNYITGELGSSGITGSSINNNIYSINFTITEETEIYLRIFTNAANIVFNNLELEIQIEEGSEYTEFEQFVPNMPSPDYPSPIKSLGDNKQLFDGIFRQGSETSTSSANLVFSLNSISCNKEEKYTISTDIDLNIYKYAIFVNTSEFPNNNPQSINTGWKTAKQTTINSTVDGYIGILVSRRNGAVFSPEDISNYHFKIEKGETATSYSPYGQGSTEINVVNKNLAEKIDGMWYSGATKILYAEAQGYGYIARIKENSKITISKKNAGNRFVVCLTKEKPVANMSCDITEFPDATTRTEYSFNNTDYKWLFFGYYRGTDVEEAKKAGENVQIEIGDKTNYEEHKEQKIVLDIQQEMLSGDYFVREADGWKEVHNWNIISFNGTENSWILTPDIAHRFRVNYDNTSLNDSNQYCTHSKTRSNWAANNGEFSVRTPNEIYFNSSDFNTLEEFKAWLVQQNTNGTPLTFYFKCEQYKINCTEEQSTVLEELNNLELFEGVNNIITAEDIALLKLKYNYVLPSPSPEAPSEIQNIRDSIKIKLSNQDGSKTKQINFPLSEGQKLMKGDYLADDGIHHVKKQKEFDGTEAYRTQAQPLDNIFCTAIFINDMKQLLKDNLLSSHFKGVLSPSSNVGISGSYLNYLYFGIEVETIGALPTQTEAEKKKLFKTWLAQQKQAGTPVVVEYELVKEEIEPYTPEQQEAYNQLCTHREITYIQTTNKFQPNMQIEYTKKPQYQSQLTVANTQQTLSLIYQTNIDDTRILISNIDSNPNTIEFTNPVLINLTKTFGEGKEPTKDWCDQNLTFFKCEEGGAPSVETSSRVKTVGSNINLFDPDNHIELDGQYRHWNTGNIASSSGYFGLKIPVLGNTVYVVNSNLIDKGRYSNLCFYDKDFHFMWGRTFNDNNQVFRTPFNCRYITLALNKNYDWFTLTYGEVPIQKVNYNLANIDMQISGYNNQFKSFPLAKGQELLQLPNGTQDTLEADGIHKRVEKIIINGTENWLKQNGVNHEKTWRFIFSRTNGSLSSAKNNCYCDKFINYSADDLWNEDIEGIAVSKSLVIIRINSEKAESVVELKQLLQDNNLVLYLPKVSEEIIPYSNAQKAWYDEFEIYRKNTQITTIAETKPWYSFTYDINDTYSVNSTKVNEYEKLGLIFNNLEDRPRFIVNRTADGSGTIKMRKPLVVDLTNAFGAGKEPDLAWCLENITFDNSCEYGTPSPNVPSELVSIGSNPIKIENKSRNLIKEQSLLNWTKKYCTAERLTEKYDSRNIYRISFENHKKGTISTRIQQKKGDMVLSIYARVIQADNPTVNRLVAAKVTSDSSASSVVSYKSLENLIGEWQKIYIPIMSTTISDAAELVLEIQHNADTDDSTIIDLCMPQLEEGFTPHDYIPYAPEKVNNLTFTTPLRQLKSGVRDEFSKDEIIRRIGEHTIKSSDKVYWIRFNQDKSYVTICSKLGIYIRGDNVWEAPSFYCNRIEDCTYLYAISQGSGTPSSRTKEGIGIIDSEYRMCLRADLMGIVETDTEEDMIRKYKVLLDEKPFIIYYEKEVADIEPLTELQKNTLANLVTRKQYDHWLISGDLNPEVELTYKLTSSINDIHPWVTGSNLLDKTWFYNDNNIHTKPYVEVDTGDADKSGISATRPIYLLNSGTETANLSLTFDYINIETPLTIQTYSGKFTDDGFVEEAKISEITIEPFTNYQPFKDIYDNNPANWKIEIDSTLGEVYLRHNTDETKVLNLNRFNKDHTFLSLADCNFVDYDKVFPTIISEIEGTAIENTIFNKVIVANTADNYRLKNVNVEWKHTYL